MGELQFDFLVEQGLQPEHHLLDVGCGALRGGLHFIRYLDSGHYFGLDVDERILKGAELELAHADLAKKAPTLLRDEAFRFARFGRKFDFALAQSVFTHLPFNAIMRCLTEMEAALVPGGRFYATIFLNPGPRLRIEDIYTDRLVHCDADPYYYDPDIFRWAVEGSTLDCTIHGEWGHPRQQQMLVFVKQSSPPRGDALS